MLPLAFPPFASVKSSSTFIPLTSMCSMSTVANVTALLATRNSSPPSSSSGLQASVALLISSSMLAIISFASLSAFFEINLCSYSRATFLPLASSLEVSVRRAFSFSKASFWAASTFLPSFVRSARKVRASSTRACASFEALAISSPAASSGVGGSSAAGASSPSFASLGASFFWKGAIAAVSFFTSASAVAIFSPASCICAVFFLPSVSFLNWLSFAAAALMRSVSLANSSIAGFEATSL
mmetsp:Transcript_5177/g.10721  ORF Transcript_5177/g.10721 Transcript_5177/m.10721 type:complete len:241 (-) Transcript_5177:896-1618(-)